MVQDVTPARSGLSGTRRLTLRPAGLQGLNWMLYRGRDLNPHGPCGPKDFKSFASTNSATPAWLKCTKTNRGMQTVSGLTIKPNAHLGWAFQVNSF